MKGPTTTEAALPTDQLAAPARRALAGAGYSRLEDLTRVTESRLGQLHGIGPKALRTLREALATGGMSFANEPEEVDEYMRNLEHPLKAEMDAVRKTILGVSPGIAEGIKWNAPSFHFKEYFATFNPRATQYVHLILHKGAKARVDGSEGSPVEDPTGLLEWLGKDRAAARFYDMQDVRSKKAALQDIVRRWIKQM